MSQTAQVRVPATTANIGPGFDCLGAALTLHNHFTFTPADSLTIIAFAFRAKTRVSLLYQALNKRECCDVVMLSTQLYIQ